MNPRVGSDELASVVKHVLDDGGYTFLRAQGGYSDGVERAVFLGPDDEPIGIPAPGKIGPLMLLAGRLAADLRDARANIDAIRSEAQQALDWHAATGMRPNSPPDLAGCPPSALRTILRMLDGADDAAAYACPDCGEDARNAALEGME